jgi:hypothetical protein
MLHLTRHIIAEEFMTDRVADTKAQAAFRVCEKLRRSLSVLTGVVGFRSVLARALVLARAEVPWLAELRLAADGSLELPAGLEASVGQEEAARGSAVLIGALLGLLVTFIGKTLTLRLVQDVWPKAALRESENREKDKL